MIVWNLVSVLDLPTLMTEFDFFDVVVVVVESGGPGASLLIVGRARRAEAAVFRDACVDQVGEAAEEGKAEDDACGYAAAGDVGGG